jgi:endoglucanase
MRRLTPRKLQAAEGSVERLRPLVPLRVCWPPLRVVPGATATPAAAPAGPGRGGFGGTQDWAAALELAIGTNGAEPYKSRLKELFPLLITPQQIGSRGWTAVRALPYLDAGAKDQLRESVKTYMAGLDKQSDATPFGVPPSLGTWGGSGSVVDMATRMYFLHKAFPDLVSPEYTLRAVNYVLGTHPVSSTSYVAGVGTVSTTRTYSNNRGDNGYIPGAVIPGYIIIKPDFPECIEDFGFLWFEHEAVVAGSASWVVAGNAADAITREAEPRP